MRGELEPRNSRSRGRQDIGYSGEQRRGHNQVSTQGVGGQRPADPQVRADHHYGDPGPVTNMAPRRREHLDRVLLSTLDHGRQVTDHAARPLCQSLLDRLVQILDHITEPARNRKDRYLTYDATSGTHLPRGGRTTGWQRWDPVRDAKRLPDREGDDTVGEICGEVLRSARSLRHGELNSVVPT